LQRRARGDNKRRQYNELGTISQWTKREVEVVAKKLVTERYEFPYIDLRKGSKVEVMGQGTEEEQVFLNGVLLKGARVAHVEERAPATYLKPALTKVYIAFGDSVLEYIDVIAKEFVQSEKRGVPGGARLEETVEHGTIGPV